MSGETRRTGRLSRRAILQLGAGTGMALAIGATGTRAERARAQAGGAFRWDIVSLQTMAGGAQLLPGGKASARAITDERFTVTGSGTFVPGARSNVTGGGTFTIRSPQGAEIGSGTYRVTELVFWEEAPGSLPPPPAGPVDTIGAAADAHSGLVVFRIALSDGNEGTLVVSCDLPVGTPPQIFEGIIVSHRFVYFYNNEAPQDNVDANRTVFHALRGPVALPNTGDGSTAEPDEP